MTAAIIGTVAKLVTRDEAGLLKHYKDANRSGFFVPHPYYDRYEYAKSEWIAVTTLLLLWALTLLARYVASYIERRAVEAVERGETLPLLGTPPAEFRAAQEAGEWAPRFAKAANALRNALLMLLAATILTTVPMPYTCRTPTHYVPGLPLPEPGHCGTCLSNGTTLGTSILSWVFIALTILWFILELASVDAISSSIVRTVMGICSFPLILAMFVVGFKEWSKIMSKDDPDCH
ncbi:hypothetical protein SpCBS45565_g00553 [Spizellomyces sp. 'palustris']|nr:hypothetical protein SpCBS45565_g00553 [Spizellomyces sp. 'palustris']